MNTTYQFTDEAHPWNESQMLDCARDLIEEQRQAEELRHKIRFQEQPFMIDTPLLHIRGEYRGYDYNVTIPFEDLNNCSDAEARKERARELIVHHIQYQLSSNS